jgi:ferritin-like metal-binding protein YciE
MNAMNSQFARSEFKLLYLTIMNIELKATYVKMLQKMIDIENQLVRYLPRMGENTTDPGLGDVIAKHTREITLQRDRIREILLQHRIPTGVERNEVFEKFLGDMEDDMLRISDNNVRDSFIISTMQMIKHIRISKYNTLVEWADFLRESEDKNLLQMTLHEEETINKKFSTLAEQSLLTVENMREFVTQ